MGESTEIEFADSTVNSLAAELNRWRSNGMSLRAIGQRIGRNHSWVSNCLHRAGYDTSHKTKPKTKIVTTHGYIAVFLPKHHLAMGNGYVYEHRMVAEKKLGRRLMAWEQIHHVDGNKQNNAPENLEVVSDAEHHLRHRRRQDLRRPNEANLLVQCGCGCGSTFYKFDPLGRPRRFLSGHNTQGEWLKRQRRHATSAGRSNLKPLRRSPKYSLHAKNEM